jgi:hypothetical protein
MFEDGLRRWISIKLIRIVLIVDIVSDSNEFPIVVGAGKKNHGNAEDFSIGDSFRIRGIGFEEKLVDTDGYGTNEKGVKLLVVLIAGFVSMLKVLG